MTLAAQPRDTQENTMHPALKRHIPKTFVRVQAPWWVAPLLALLALTAHAELTDLSDSPLANVSSTTQIKPNILFVMDDSGSMAWHYSPDYVTSASSTSLAPRYTGFLGDPPYMSAQYNLQYYNPRIRYLPPIGYDGGTSQGSLSFPSQNRSQTTNWTRVRTDGFDEQNYSILHTNGNNKNLNQGVTSTQTNFNLAEGFPDRVYCTAAGDNVNDTDLCKTNDPGFLYAHGHSNLATGSYTVGESSSGTPKYRFGGPYYYNIRPWEYCADAELTDCVQVTPGAAAPTGYPFEARVRWCSSATNAMKTTTTASECRGRRGPGFQTPRFSPQANASVAYGLITVDGNWCSGTSNSTACNAYEAVIEEVSVGGVSIIGTEEPSYTGNSSTRHEIMARNIAAAINRHNGTPEYIACVGGGTSATNAPRCNQAPYAQLNLGTLGNNTVVVIAVNTLNGDISDAVTDSSRAGLNIEVTPNAAEGTMPAWGRINVSESGNGTGNITSVRVGPEGGPYTEILSGPLSSNFTSSTSGNSTQKTNARRAAAQAICNRINARTATTGYRANTRDTVPSSPTSSINTTCDTSRQTVTIIAPTAQGDAPNGWEILTTPTGTNTVILPATVSGTALLRAGYTTPVVATTAGSIGAGAWPVSAFERVSIVSTRTSYPKDPARTDCTTTAGVCTYDEEMTNFANWFTYYRTRNQMMKAATGHAFLSLGESYRLGFNTINNSSFNNTSGTRWASVQNLNSTQKSLFYDKVYGNSLSGGTPLRQALGRAGEYYAGTLSGANSPVQYSCQRNYAILTTDGYWNGSEAASKVDDADNVNDALLYCTRANGCYDGGLTADRQTLSDVAAYYYRTDLRDDLVDNVPVTSDDPNSAQHMTTFTLGIGVDGLMRYRKDYDTATEGDFYKIRTGATGCEWQSSSAVCNWPIATNDNDTAVDDLWHAAVSGHGRYFSAKDPTSLAEALAGTLNALQIKTGAAAASSTSTPNITQEDNLEFSATFRTVKWDGELVAQYINVSDGSTQEDVIWSARTKLQTRTSATSDSRILFTTSNTSTPAYRDLAWDELSTAEKAWFENKCSGTGLLSQCVTLTTEQKSLLNNGEAMLKYLRGQRSLENVEISTDNFVEVLRRRDYVLADIAGSRPSYVARPKRNYGDDGYASFKSDKSDRDGVVYVGSNGGMMHAFNVSDGQERWAYMPRMVMPNLYQLASTGYGTDHRFFVDGSPTVADVRSSSTAGDVTTHTWSTILVGGLNKGGRGYYALDITDPDDPQPLWEICHDATLCPQRNDADMGYSFSEPIVTKLPAGSPNAGKWVVIVSSGYNNVSPGTGRGFLFVLDALTGAVLHKIATGEGTTSTPSGLGKVADFVTNPDVDNTVLLAYAGDLLGNLWRFDLATNTAVKQAQLTDASGTSQPITARPETGQCGDRKMVFVGTGKYLGASDVETTQLQTMWGIRDSSTALGVLRGSDTMVQQTLSGSGSTYTVSNNPVNLAEKNGWYVNFDRNSGERVNLDPLLVNKNLLVLTNQPVSDGSAACGTGGKGFLYQFSYCTGSYLASPNAPQVGEHISDSIVVGFTPIGLPSGTVPVKVITAEGIKLPPIPITQEGGAGGAMRRISWRELID